MSKINIIYKIKNNDNIKSDKVRAIFLDGIITYNEENSIVKAISGKFNGTVVTV